MQHPGQCRYPPRVGWILGFWIRYHALRRQKIRDDLLGAAAFLIAFGVAAYIGDLDPIKIWNGLPRLHEFVLKILPVLRWETLSADLAEWLLPFRIWMGPEKLKSNLITRPRLYHSIFDFGI